MSLIKILNNLGLNLAPWEKIKIILVLLTWWWQVSKLSGVNHSGESTSSWTVKQSKNEQKHSSF